MQKECVTEMELRSSITEFEGRLAKVDELQSQIEDEVEQSQIEEIVEEAFCYREKQKEVKVRALICLQKLSEIKESHISDLKTSQTSTSSHVGRARLPKLELPKFSGNYLEFTSFFDKFLAVVDGSELPAVTKFTYLQSLLTGEALASINGLTVTDDSYPVAKEILTKRYGRKERIIFSHIQTLLSLQVDCRKSNGLWSLYDSLQSHVRCLESLGVSGDTYGVILTPLILSRLPQEIRMEWAREGEGRESDLAFLLDFLFREIKRRERSETFDKSHEMKNQRLNDQTKKPAPSVATFHANSCNQNKTQCGFCRKTNHASEQCYSIKGLNGEELRGKVRDSRLCYICLGKHFARDCYSKIKCKGCGGRHNSILCTKGNPSVSASSDQSTPLRETQPQSQNQRNVVSYAHFENQNRTTVMQVVKAKLQSKGGKIVEANVLFDGGSDLSFVTQDLVKKLDLKKSGEETFSFSGFGDAESGPRTKRKVYNVELGGISVKLAGIDTLCAEMYRSPVPRQVISKFNIEFSEDFEVDRSIKVDILIGLDYYWELVSPERVQIDSLVAQKTRCGWMLSGSYAGKSVSKGFQMLCLNNISENVLRSLWELDDIGIVDDDASPAANKVMAKFEESTTFQKGRYEVNLPWKENQKGRLMDNKGIAEKRLHSLSRRLAGNPKLKEAYNENLSEMEKAGMIKEVSKCEKREGPIFYLPHRPVVREDSITTKVRPVFDASAKGYNGVSLNDCLETGPNRLPNLLGLLMRFRRWKVAVTADVAKAFLQIRVHEADQNVLRFLWELGGQVREMVFDRVPFGTTASPFLLNATIKHHLGKYPNSKTIEELETNLYVDDFLSGADTEEEALDLVVEAKKTMAEAGMDLTKWSSNSKKVADTILKEFDPRFAVAESTKVLDLKWIPAEDNFSFSALPVPADVTISKRTVLSYIARLFDPLGFLAPFIISAKLIFQQLWELQIDWDDEFPNPLKGQFENWLKELGSLQEWKIPRFFATFSWRDADEIQLHIFCDASEKAYGCCAYLRVVEGTSVSVNLILTKARVAPLKTVTLPRLELLGTLLGSRVLKFLISELHLSCDTVYKCYTDSMVALGWIKGSSSRWKAFVANRVQEIQNLTDPCCWNHIAGSDNPADLLTRGLSAKALTGSVEWLHGPRWLASNSLPESETALNQEHEDIIHREVRVTQCVTIEDSDKEPLLKVGKWSSLAKLTRIMSWVLRFVTRCRKKPMEHCDGDKLTSAEVSQANKQLTLMTQSEHFEEEIACLKAGKHVAKSSNLYKLSPFIGEDGLLRARCRLNYSDLTFDEKFPILLPKCHFSLLIVREKHAQLKHAGVSQMITAVRNHYWVIGLRSLARKVKGECLSCKRVDARACQEPMAPLMEARLKKAPAFNTTGLDYAGPVYCKDFPGEKFYILLFTCAVTRAVHLELVNSLSLTHFLLAFRRFVSRRGLPKTVFSDNAKTFKSASTELLKLYGSNSPYWRFSVPRAPWWGGWWERMVRNMKVSLKKTVGLKSLERTELETLLTEVEACLNSRPLTFVGDDIDNGHPLTPSHFLLGRGSHLDKVSCEPSLDVSPELLKEKSKALEGRCDMFWKQWQDEYLKHLPLPKRRDKFGKLEVGSVVLIREDNCPRLQWPMGVVERLIPGKDGVARTVEVRTKRGNFFRPIQRLHGMELNEEQATEEVRKENVYHTRFGRPSKSTVRFNIDSN